MRQDMKQEVNCSLQCSNMLFHEQTHNICTHGAATTWTMPLLQSKVCIPWRFWWIWQNVLWESPLKPPVSKSQPGTVLLGRGGMHISNKSCSFLVCSYFLSLRIKINTEMYFPWAGTVSKNIAVRTLW